MVNVEKLRGEAATTSYSHMVMLPFDVQWLCEEIMRLRGTPYEPPATTPSEQYGDGNGPSKEGADGSVADLSPQPATTPPTKAAGLPEEGAGGSVADQPEQPEEKAHESTDQTSA